MDKVIRKGGKGGGERGRRTLLDLVSPFHREKQLLLGGDNFGRDLTSVQNLQKKHQRFEDELSDREARIGAVLSRGEELTKASHYAQAAIEDQCSKLQDMWQDLNTASDLRYFLE